MEETCEQYKYCKVRLFLEKAMLEIERQVLGRDASFNPTTSIRAPQLVNDNVLPGFMRVTVDGVKRESFQLWRNTAEENAHGVDDEFHSYEYTEDSIDYYIAVLPALAPLFDSVGMPNTFKERAGAFRLGNNQLIVLGALVRNEFSSPYASRLLLARGWNGNGNAYIGRSNQRFDDKTKVPSILRLRTDEDTAYVYESVNLEEFPMDLQIHTAKFKEHSVWALWISDHARKTYPDSDGYVTINLPCTSFRDRMHWDAIQARVNRDTALRSECSF